MVIFPSSSHVVPITLVTLVILVTLVHTSLENGKMVKNSAEVLH